MAVLNLNTLLARIDATIRIAGAGGKITATEHRQLLVDVADTLFGREASGVAAGLVSNLKDGNTTDTIRTLRESVDTLTAQLAQAGGAPESLRFAVYSDLDTSGAEATMKGIKPVSDIYHSASIVGVSFQVKSDAATTFTAQPTVADLNNWIGNTANVVDSDSLWQVYPVADFGTSGPNDPPKSGSITMVF